MLEDSTHYAPASQQEHLLNEEDAVASDYMSTPYQIARELNRPPAPAWKATLESSWVPIIITLISCNGALLFGYHNGYSSPAEDAIIEKVGLTQSKADLVFSIMNVGGMFGSLVAGKAADTFGRKKAVMLSTIPLSLGALIMVLSADFAGLLIGRIIIGFAIGYNSVLVPLYIAESAPANLRGSLGALNQLFIAFGIFVANLLGLPIISHPGYWKLLLLWSLVFVVILGVGLLIFGVESPRWLLDQNRVDDAAHALQKLRGPKADIDAELESLMQKEEATDEEMSQVNYIDEDAEGSRDGIAILWHPSVRRQFAIGIGLVTLQQLSGINAFIFNTKLIFEGDADTATKSDELSALHGAVIVNAVQVFFTGVSASAIDKLGRRFFLLLSSIGMAASCFIMGYVYYVDASEGVKILMVIVYLSFFALGLGPVPWLSASEIYPAKGRGTLISVTIVCSWVAAFAVTESFTGLNDGLQPYGTFWFYGIMCAIGAAGIYFFVPETKGKTLSEIEELFRSYRTRK